MRIITANQNMPLDLLLKNHGISTALTSQILEDNRNRDLAIQGNFIPFGTKIYIREDLSQAKTTTITLWS